MAVRADLLFLLAGFLSVTCNAAAQSLPPHPPAQQPPEISRPASPLPPATADAEKPDAKSATRNDDGFLALPKQILRDQKFFWTRPFRLTRADTRWTIGAVGATALMFTIDEPVAEKLGSQPTGSGFTFSRRVGMFSGSIANFGTAGLFYGFGHLLHNERARNTGVLAFRALSNSIIITSGIKFGTQRQRPARGGVPINEMEGVFYEGGTSFPSGHSANAWTLATVVAGQYRHRRWVPPVAYGLATLVSASRVGARKHFPSDVVVGGLIGYWIGRHVLTESGTPSPERKWQVVPTSARGGGAALTLLWQP